MNDIIFPIAYSKLFEENLKFPGIDEDFVINIDLSNMSLLDNKDIEFIRRGGPNNDFYNLPIFIIQSHGALSSSITLNSRNRIEGKRSIEFSRDSNIFKNTNNGEWVIYNSPVGTLGIASSKDNKFVNYVNNNMTTFKNKLFSKNPRQIYDLTNGYYKIKNTSFFCPPLNTYPDKEHYFYDTPKRDDTYIWTMGILPIFKENIKKEEIPTFYYKKDEFENETEDDLYARVFNNTIIDKINWLRSGRGKYGDIKSNKPIRKHYWWPPTPIEWISKDYIPLSERYKYMTDVINSSLPILRYDNSYSKYRKTSEDWNGKYILMSEIMSILGPGIYLSLSCTPFMDERSVYLKKEFIQDRHVVERNIKLKVFEDIIAKIINPICLKNWKKICEKKKFSVRNRKKHYNKLQIERDTDAAINKTTTMAIGFREKNKKTKKKKV